MDIMDEELTGAEEDRPRQVGAIRQAPVKAVELELHLDKHVGFQ